ncbi:DNA invertase Pin-like site-specific DNA recombinase [Micromonospora pisi]|uniref:DNA invertase Pin-like site-specific DNA recombinase n=1 Tax=Micromonospora pisi TaxID=589240 RepID=A0A495JXE7_9ACTN|nr:recombinase family protein [Micromonospora pisi]RKR92869.1 DNA invertase Pin-like site-specific DNA recombinase [Micromonospora pisi]
MSPRATGRPALHAVTTLTAVLYTRVSMDRRGRRKSVLEQDKDARAVVADEGWSLPDDACFTDNNRSASRFATRPRVGWDALLEYLATHPVHVLIVWEVSRAERKLGPWVAVLDLCRDRKILIHVLKDQETYDPCKTRDRKSLAQDGLNAESETELLSERIRRDKRNAAANGRPAGIVPYGYMREYDGHGHYLRQVPHPGQVEVLRWMAERVDRGTPLRRIARILNERRATARREAWERAREIGATDRPWGERWKAVRDVVTAGRVWDAPRGGEWSHSQVRVTLLRRTYIAERVHQGEVIGPAKWPGLIDEDRFLRIRGRLLDPARRNGDDNSLTYQLSGGALCGVCRSPLRPQARINYRCEKSGCMAVAAKVRDLDPAVDRFILARLRQEDAAPVFATQSSDAALEEARRTERELQAELDEYYDLAGARRLSPAGLAAMEARLRPQIEAAARRVRELSVPAVLRGLDPIKLADTWPDNPVYIRREVIVALAEIVLSPTGKGFRFSVQRLAQSRWRGDELTWGERWELAG